ncbi:MAG TPA: class I SAM-dependent methyltransferase [Oligoflexus sp.]|uniref:class I SAM-dependent methyltransferase n=1 Tax=Oligoflexus sp. TaxID=1971216 RepID=UPI002D70592D|nr:class I SAM-dependent methyltransferase [Oligoflexus sp.]HYX38503.1 class I SAM-dependent methyltransferase [Oligoflexus sp.]
MMLSTQSENQYTFENVSCYLCGSDQYTDFIQAQDDLSGRPGTFHFVRCQSCGLAYQQPRIVFSEIGGFYDDEYIAHRKKSNWGILTRFYNARMSKHDRDKWNIVREHVRLHSQSRVLDIGCGAGTFLQKVQEETGAQCFGVDFKNLSHSPAFAHAQFLQGTLFEQELEPASFDLITMWHFLEHDYRPLETLTRIRQLLKPEGKLILEVPRLDSVSFSIFKNRWPGLQAPQHTLLLDRKSFLSMLENSAFHVDKYLPFGAFPAYFYFFAGAVFKRRKGAGVNFGRAIYPYFLGEVISKPLFSMERYLNLAMQTAVCTQAPSH